MVVVINGVEVDNWKRNWPCSNIPELYSLTFTFENNGDLVDIEAIDEDGEQVDIDGPDVLAISQDAQAGLIGTQVA